MTISQLTSTVAETVAETVVLTTNPEDGNARREESTQDGYHTAITMAREVMDTGRSRKELRVAVLLCATRVSIINWQGGGASLFVIRKGKFSLQNGPVGGSRRR